MHFMCCNVECLISATKQFHLLDIPLNPKVSIGSTLLSHWSRWKIIFIFNVKFNLPKSSI